MLNLLTLLLFLTLISGVFGLVGDSGSIEGTARMLFVVFAGLSASLFLARHERSLLP